MKKNEFLTIRVSPLAYQVYNELKADDKVLIQELLSCEFTFVSYSLHSEIISENDEYLRTEHMINLCKKGLSENDK